MNTMQMEMVSLEQLVPQNHSYRKLKELLDTSIYGRFI